MAHGLAFAMGETPSGYIRLNFRSPTEEQIHPGIHMLAAAFEALQEKRSNRRSSSDGTCTLV